MQSKKKLIYLSHWRIPSEKTMSPLVTRTGAEFVKCGYDVELWVPFRQGVSRTADPFTEHHIETRFLVKRIPALDLVSGLGKIGFVILLASLNISSFLILALRRIRGEQFILYAHDMRDVILPSIVAPALFIEIHDYYESSLRFVNTFVLKRTNGLVVTNSIKQRNIYDRYGFPISRMIRQPNAVDASMFDIAVSKEDARRRLGLPTDRKIALYTGHLFRWKGVFTLADAANHLDDIYIYFVGGTEDDRKQLQAHVQCNGLPRIEFLPHQDHQRIPYFLKAADVLVLPNTATDTASKYETSPVKLFEYMASGTPVVATRLPSILELISEEYARIVEPDDPQAMGKAISDTLAEPNAMHAVRAREWAKKHSWSSRATNISELIESNMNPQKALVD